MSPRKTWLKGEVRRQIRTYLAQRDGAHCHYCQQPFAADLKDATLDHYIPRSLWLQDKPRNLVLACDPCNQAKGAALPLTLAWLLLRTAAEDPARFAVTA